MQTLARFMRITRMIAMTSSRSQKIKRYFCCVTSLLQMLNIEIFKAPRVGGVDVYECLALDVAAMEVCPLFLITASTYLSVKRVLIFRVYPILILFRSAFLTNFSCFYTTSSSKRKRKRFYR
jgi:hypothetical protein